MIETNKIYCENCLETMARMADASIDAIVTDPPYGLKFMGKRWDCEVPGVDIWRECLRVLKPGGHLLAFAGTRTQHRMAVNIEDAGFDIRDMIAWVYGSGFPKSMDVSKAIDKMNGAEREVVGEYQYKDRLPNSRNSDGLNKYGIDKRTAEQQMQTAPATPEAEQWNGWGTALKPAFEPITVARKPLIGTVAENVLAHGTGGLNVDGCRIAACNENLNGGGYYKGKHEGWIRPWTDDPEMVANAMIRAKEKVALAEKLGRFPANFIHDGSEEVMALFPETASGENKEGSIQGCAKNGIYGDYEGFAGNAYASNSGSAARFFYTAKASPSERGDGNNHPTVKPLALMRYLVRLVTPPGGLVYDPFAGSGTTLIAAIEEGFEAIGSDLEAAHCAIFQRRIRHGLQPKMF